jgi:nitroreductase
VIALGLKRSVNPNIPEWEDIAAVACAVQNMYLSVTAYGLVGYWTTGGVTNRAQAKPFFNLTEADKLMGFFFIGHVAVPSTGGKRKPLEEKSTWIKE